MEQLLTFISLHAEYCSDVMPLSLHNSFKVDSTNICITDAKNGCLGHTVVAVGFEPKSDVKI